MTHPLKLSLEVKIFLLIFFAITFFINLVLVSAHQGYQLEIRCRDGYEEPGTFCSVQSNGFLKASKSYETCLNNSRFCRGGAYDIISAEPVNIKTPVNRVLSASIMSIIYCGILAAIIYLVRFIKLLVKRVAK